MKKFEIYFAIGARNTVCYIGMFNMTTVKITTHTEVLQFEKYFIGVPGHQHIIDMAKPPGVYTATVNRRGDDGWSIVDIKKPSNCFCHLTSF